METVIDIIIRLAATLLIYGGYLLLKNAAAYLKGKFENENLDKFIEECVKAAEQMYKLEDPSGDKRLAYVQKMLVEAGYEMTEAIRAIIESKVYEVNIANKVGVAK